MESYNNLNLLQLKNLKAKEKDPIIKNIIKTAINKIIKSSQTKWDYTSLLNNKSNKLSDSSDITITTDTTDTKESQGEIEENKELIDSKLTNYDITKYYHKISKKNDNNDELFNRMVNFADFLTNKPSINKEDIDFIRKPFENIKINKKQEISLNNSIKNNGDNKVLGKRKYIN